MGLLGQILGGLAGNALGRSPIGAASGGGSSRVLMALLPVVLGMLADRQGGTTGGLPGTGASRYGGAGRSDALGGALGALGGVAGLGQLIEQFTRKGYANQASSWVGTGANEPIPPEAVTDVFGQERLSEIASQAGVSDDEARAGLSELLPEVVDHFTPQGQIPPADQLASSIEQYTRQLPR